MDKFEDFYKEHCLDHFGYDPDLNWIFEKHEDGSYIQIEVENAKKVYQHQQAKVDQLKDQLIKLGFTDNGGELMKPPLGKPPKFDLLDVLQAKVDELKASHHGEVIGHEVHFKKIKQERDELQTLYTQQGINMLKLQKRVEALELKLREIAGIARRARHGEYHTESGRNAGLNIAAEIEQALKGEGQ